MGGNAGQAALSNNRIPTWLRISTIVAIAVAALVLFVAFDADPVFAQDDELEGVTTLQEIMYRIRDWIQALAATFCVVMVCVAGARYLGSSDPTGSEKAKNALKAAAIGLGIVLLAGPLVSILTWFIQGG